MLLLEESAERYTPPLKALRNSNYENLITTGVHGLEEQLMRLLQRFLVVFCSYLFLTGNSAVANPSHCYSIQNQDSKNLCLALVNKQKSNCYSIGSSDLKNMCLAHVGEQRSNCYSIQSSDMKNLCLALVR